MVRFEWLIIELIVLGLAIFELVRTRRGLRQLREAERAKAAEQARVAGTGSDGVG